MNRISDKRPPVDMAIVNLAVYEIQRKMAGIFTRKGIGAWLSRHEILGIATEEDYELDLAMVSKIKNAAMEKLKEAVHRGSLDDVESELEDLAIACIFGKACIKSGEVQW